MEGKLELSSLADEVFTSSGPSGEQSFTDSATLELKRRAPARRERVLRVVDWEQEQKSLQKLRTDKGVWFIAKVLEALLALKLGMTLTRAAEDSRFATFVDLAISPLMLPVNKAVAKVVDLDAPLRICVAMLAYFLLFSMLASLVRPAGAVDRHP